MKDGRTTYEVYLETIQEGYFARVDGKSIEENPHTEYPTMSKWWADGWHDANSIEFSGRRRRS